MKNKLETWHIKTSDILLIAWLFFVSFVLSLYVSKGIVGIFGESTLATLISTLVMQVCFLIFAIGVNLYFKFELFKARLGFGDLIRNALKYFFLGVVIVFCINIIANVIAMYFDYTFEAQAAIELWLSTNGVFEKLLAFVPTVILAPLAEELVFRGLLYRLLKTRMPVILAMITSSVLFGLIHGSLFALVPLSVLAMLFCFIYEKFGDLRLCILVHCLFNLLNVSFLILLTAEG